MQHSILTSVGYIAAAGFLESLHLLSPTLSAPLSIISSSFGLFSHKGQFEESGEQNFLIDLSAL